MWSCIGVKFNTENTYSEIIKEEAYVKVGEKTRVNIKEVGIDNLQAITHVVNCITSVDWNNADFRIQTKHGNTQYERPN